MEAPPASFGKQVFFLNPPAVINEVLPALAEAEFELYTSKDHLKLGRYFKTHPNCMVFVNIDADDDENVWRKWIKSLRDDPDCAAIGIGVVTMQGNDDQRAAYLMELGVDCGFIVLKIGAAKTGEILIKTLSANEARGQRKFVRTKCPADSAEFNCKIDKDVVRGKILDLSIVGMAAIFTDGNAPAINSRLHDMQLSLRGARIIANGIVVGIQDHGLDGAIRVLLFEPATLNDEKRMKIRAFIRKASQAQMEMQLLTT